MQLQECRLLLIWLGLTISAGCSFSSGAPPSLAQQVAAHSASSTSFESPRTPRIYVANFYNGKVLEFSLTANGNVAPSREIAGPKTLIGNLRTLGVDAAGYVYAPLFSTSQDPATVGVFAPNQHGNVAPLRTFTDAISAHRPQRIAVDPTGTVYLLYFDAAFHQGIDVFAPGAHGTVQPIREIAGPKSLLDLQETIIALVADDHGGVWWACDGEFGPPRVVGYAPGANGDVAPVVVLDKNPTTEIKSPSALSVDAKGYVYVESAFDINKEGVLVFAPGATGTVAPVRITRFTGDFHLGTVHERALLAVGIVNNNEYAIGTFDSQKHGLQSPSRVIVGAKTQMVEPMDPQVR
jgi:hypothetical protein